MGTLLPSLTAQAHSLQCETTKVSKWAATTSFDYGNRRACKLYRMDNLRKYQVRGKASQYVTRNSRRGMDLKVSTSSQSSIYEIGPGLFTSTTIEKKEIEKAASYLFRAEIGGLVKVNVQKKNMKYTILIEVSSLPEWASKNDLVLSWGIYSSDSSSFMPLESQESASETGSNTFQTPFIQKDQKVLSVDMDFELKHAPFYLSFLLKCQSDVSPSKLEIRSHRKTTFCVPVGVHSGCPAPLGISHANDGSVNFALFSRNADSVNLCLYDKLADKPSLEIALDPYINRTGDIWHVSMESVAPYIGYGYRCKAPSHSGQGGMIHTNHVLLDPYAKILRDLSPDQSAPSPTKCIGHLHEDLVFDWSDEKRPCLPMENLVVYRLNVKNFTEDKSSQLPAGVAGTFSGLIEKMHHFKSLGVNAILLEPIFSFDVQKGPYFPYHFFSPMNSYGPAYDGLSTVNSMKEMVKKLHSNGIEVLLEVVYSHTTDEIGFQGIDKYSYYQVDNEVGSGSRSALNCNNPVVQQMILDSLRYWVAEFHIDGFSFVNASSLLCKSDGNCLHRHALIEAIAFDPVLSKAKVIADCLDPYDMVFKEVRFPHWKRWAEMNTRFCQDVRNFLRGEGLISNLATRLCGSGDVFLGGRGPAFSFNFVSRNFGLSIVDLVSFSGSGLSSELSWNCGEEGPTNKVDVLETRLKQIRNFLFILYISLGVPVLSVGDECGQSYGGSQLYSKRKPFNWGALQTNFGVQMTQFIAFLSSFRVRRRDLLQRRNFLQEENIDWYGSDLAQPRWEDQSCKFLAMRFKAHIDNGQSSSESGHMEGDLFIAFNANDQSESIKLPSPSEGMAWFRLVDTALPFPGFFSIDGYPVVKKKTVLLSYDVKSHSCVLFEARGSTV